MIDKSVARKGTSHHRVDERFADLFEEDFGIRPFYGRALVGIPKKQAIAVCQWAADNIADAEERGEAIVAYCKKRGIGRYDRRLIDAPELTFEQTVHARRVSERAMREERS